MVATLSTKERQGVHLAPAGCHGCLSQTDDVRTTFENVGGGKGGRQAIRE